jgi:phosphoglycerate dehydrogenase-like enzyme
MNATALESAIIKRNRDVDLKIARTPEETAAVAMDIEILISSFVEPELLEEMTSLRWIQAPSAGVDYFDLDLFRERNLLLTNAAGVHAQPIAEQVFGYMLAFERRFGQAVNNERRGVWERYIGGELANKTLGVVGLGEIGSRVAEIADAIGMRVVGTKRDPSEAPEIVDWVKGSDSLYDVLVEADYVVIACPLTDETRGLFSDDEVSAMKDDAVLINVARGSIVDEQALTKALQQRTIRGAALDVFETEPLPSESPLWDLSNVFITPHNAGSTPKLPDRIAKLFLENYDAFADGDIELMRNRVL